MTDIEHPDFYHTEYLNKDKHSADCKWPRTAPSYGRCTVTARRIQTHQKEREPPRGGRGG